MRRDARLRRVLGRLRGAARRYHVPVVRVALRALRLSLRGWRLGDMAAAGLLDPRERLTTKPWAVLPRDLERLQEALNPPEAVPLCEDKRLFEESCRRFGLPTPALAATLERTVDASDTARSWAALLAERCPVEFVVKPVDGHRGIGVRVMTRTPAGAADHEGHATSWDDLAHELAAEPHGAYVVQERLRPHPALRRLTGSDALQTIRVMTLVEPDGEARILSWAIRLTVAGQPIDSFHGGTTGNLWAPMHDDGSLMTPVTVGEGGFGYVRVPVHPVTGDPLTGVVIPGWREARELALRAAAAFDVLPAIGWDVAVTDDGIVLAEGNAWWSLLDPAGPSVEVADALRASIAARARTGSRKAGATPHVGLD